MATIVLMRTSNFEKMNYGTLSNSVMCIQDTPNEFISVAHRHVSQDNSTALLFYLKRQEASALAPTSVGRLMVCILKTILSANLLGRVSVYGIEIPNMISESTSF